MASKANSEVRKANDIALENENPYYIVGDGKSPKVVFSSRECRKSALDMAKWKDERFKQFLLEHIDIPFEGNYGVDGSPLAGDFIEWIKKKEAYANEMFETYKKFE